MHPSATPARDQPFWKPASPLSATILPSVSEPMGDQNFSTTPTLACGIYRMPSNHFNAAAQTVNTATPTTTFTIGFNAFLDCVIQLLRRRPEIAAAGVRGIVAVAGGGWTRVKIFLDGEVLAQQLRAAHSAVLFHNQTSVGFVVKRCLCDAKHNHRINSTTNDRKNQRGHYRAANFRE